MVNCNPETVSTDYDTSDRLYFEPLNEEEVLAILEREQPVGVVIQFGGQTPLKLARAIERAGYTVLGTPFEAIDLAEDRERFGALADRLGVQCPAWGRPRRSTRPSRSPSGSATRCWSDLRTCSAAARCASASRPTRSAPRWLRPAGGVLIDRFVENAVEIDVDALCDGHDTYVAAVMQHVEEAGVHSGDSSCVLPAPSLTPQQAADVDAFVRRLGPALGVVGLLNVQLAIADGEVYVLEVNPRASRTVPFASKAIGVNLVEAACRLAAGATLSDVGLPRRATPHEVSVKAAVLPFHRFPGADPVLGPEMRSTGEVMATAEDLPTAFAKAERAAGARCRRRERPSCPSAMRTSRTSCRWPPRSSAWASR